MSARVFAVPDTKRQIPDPRDTRAKKEEAVIVYEFLGLYDGAILNKKE